MGTDGFVRHERLVRTATSMGTTFAWLLLSACGPMADEYQAEADAYDQGVDAGSEEPEDKAVSVAYQAENRTGQSGCTASSAHAGYSGTGFMDYGGNGSWIEWNQVNITRAGEHDITLKYANGGASNRQMAVIINGTSVGNVAFPSTGSWSSWKTTTLKATLRAGRNTIRIMANTSAGGPNLDSMTILARSGGSCADQCTSACPCEEGQGDCDSDSDCAPGLVCEPDGPGAEVCVKAGSGGGSPAGGSVRDLDFASFSKLVNEVTTFNNVNAKYIVYAESHGREGHNDIRSNQPGFVGMKGATLVGYGGGRDKYLAIFKVNSSTVVIDKDQAHQGRGGGSSQALFIRTSKALTVAEARTVDPAVKGESVPGPKSSNEIVIYAEDEGGKGDRDQFFMPRAHRYYGSGDDLLYVFARNLSGGPNGNGAFMRLTIR